MQSYFRHAFSPMNSFCSYLHMGPILFLSHYTSKPESPACRWRIPRITGNLCFQWALLLIFFVCFCLQIRGVLWFWSCVSPPRGGIQQVPSLLFIPLNSFALIKTFHFQTLSSFFLHSSFFNAFCVSCAPSVYVRYYCIIVSRSRLFFLFMSLDFMVFSFQAIYLIVYLASQLFGWKCPTESLPHYLWIVFMVA